ncbi:MAG: chromate transporter [Lachnospiraceae bacterium]|nr:chromate transporter [Lachnospiraceae bacterium]
MNEPSGAPREKNIYLSLFLTFLMIGAFTFGGGYAMIPVIQREIVDKHHWLEKDDLLEMLAVSESTPGPIAVNSATYVGYKVAGTGGAFLSTLGVVLPAFVIMSRLSLVLEAFSTLRAVRYAFIGIRACVLALVLKAFISMFKQCPKDILSLVIMAAAAAIVTFTGISPIYVILGCAAVGIAFTLIMKRRAGK